MAEVSLYEIPACIAVRGTLSPGAVLSGGGLASPPGLDGITVRPILSARCAGSGIETCVGLDATRTELRAGVGTPKARRPHPLRPCRSPLPQRHLWSLPSASSPVSRIITGAGGQRVRRAARDRSRAPGAASSGGHRPPRWAAGASGGSGAERRSTRTESPKK